MQQDNKGNATATIEEVSRYNMLMTEALFELLAEKGILSGEELLERIKKLKAKSSLNLPRIQ